MLPYNGCINYITAQYVTMPKKILQQSTTGSGSLLENGIINRIIPESSEMDSILSTMEKLLHWAAIIESSDDAIISKSVQGIITSWNPGAQRLYGYTPEEIIGKPVSMLMPPEKENDFPNIMKQLLAGHKVEHYQTKRKTKDGRVIDVSITVSPIRDSQGNIIGASKIARDITERVEIEKRRDEFVSITSHELKSPITSQKLYGELLEKLIEENGDTVYKPYIAKINTQTKKLEKLINDLLDLSRLQAGQLQLDHNTFTLHELLDEVIADMAATTSSHAIVFDNKGNEPLNPSMTGDWERLAQVFTNLISNAVKYSPDADQVIISARSHDDAIEIMVQDFGIGISPQYHTRIFERFFRVSDEDEKTFPGMGIGLDFSKEVVERHGGKIWVESQKGEGASFFVLLPINAFELI